MRAWGGLHVAVRAFLGKHKGETEEEQWILVILQPQQSMIVQLGHIDKEIGKTGCSRKWGGTNGQ